MEYIWNPDGTVRSSSRNLRGIRRYVSKNPVKRVIVYELLDGAAILRIRFDGGAFSDTQFADLDVLRNSLRYWRNLYGAELHVDSQAYPMRREGVVGRQTTYLVTGD